MSDLTIARIVFVGSLAWLAIVVLVLAGFGWFFSRPC
jgi:hypothetical protein